jgi:hypothetical protein
VPHDPVYDRSVCLAERAIDGVLRLGTEAAPRQPKHQRRGERVGEQLEEASGLATYTVSHPPIIVAAHPPNERAQTGRLPIKRLSKETRSRAEHFARIHGVTLSRVAGRCLVQRCGFTAA